MAELPKGADLLYNPINNMPAFSLDKRYFFMPGFPEMSHPMVTEILKKLIPYKKNIYRHTLTAKCRENIFIEVMENMPKDVEFSSLPKIIKDGWSISISVASDDAQLAQDAFDQYIAVLAKNNIPYTLDDKA
jgi:molybdopterin-biosynthesis enzyme MoeA-like protein